MMGVAGVVAVVFFFNSCTIFPPLLNNIYRKDPGQYIWYTGLLQDSGFSTSYITDTKKRGEYKKKVYDALIKEKKRAARYEKQHNSSSLSPPIVSHSGAEGRDAVFLYYYII